MMGELEYLAEISEKLSTIADKLDMVIFIGVFAIFIHYTERWLKLAIESERRK